MISWKPKDFPAAGNTVVPPGMRVLFYIPGGAEGVFAQKFALFFPKVCCIFW